MGCGGSAPAAPDYGAQARESIMADLSTYPMRYLVNAASQTGGNVNVGGQNYDFTGLGNADVSAGMSDQMAQALLDIQRNYGADYVKQRLADLQQSDPQGYAARQQLFDRIIAQVDQNPDRPLATDLQNQVMGELQKSGNLDDRELQQVQNQVRGGQVANNNYLGNAATSQEASAVINAADQQQTARQQQALAYLNSGVSPEDVAYRRLQQNLGNLSSFTSGATPEAQFHDLSSAGTAAAPFTGTGTSMPLTNPNAISQGNAANLGIYQGTQNWQQSQMNPWMAGLSMGAQSAGTLGKLGIYGGKWAPGPAPYGTYSTGTTSQDSSYAPGAYYGNP